MATEYAPGGPIVDLASAGGWCAPSEAMLYVFDPVMISKWPYGLTTADIEWLSAMLWLGEIDPDPIQFAEPLDLPSFMAVRGGLRFPVPGDAA